MHKQHIVQKRSQTNDQKAKCAPDECIKKAMHAQPLAASAFLTLRLVRVSLNYSHPLWFPVKRPLCDLLNKTLTQITLPFYTHSLTQTCITVLNCTLFQCKTCVAFSMATKHKHERRVYQWPAGCRCRSSFQAKHMHRGFNTRFVRISFLI